MGVCLYGGEYDVDYNAEGGAEADGCGGAF